MKLRIAAFLAIAILLCQGWKADAQTTYLSSKTSATSLNPTDTTWWCQVVGSGGASGCTSASALDSVELSVLSAYFASLSETLTNKTVNCANNTCTNFPGGTVFTGTVTSSSSTVYTMTATGYTATAGNVVCTSSFTPANGANPTLNIAGTGAKPIKLLTGTGLLSLTNSEIPNTGPVCFMYDGTNEVLQTALVSPVALSGTDTVTAAKFAACQPYVISSASQTITLPASTGLPPGGCISIQTIGNTVSLAPTSASGDAIDNGQVGGGAANAAITIPSDITTVVTYSGTPGVTAYYAPLGPVQYFPFTWLPGQNLASLSTGSGCSTSGGSTPPCGFGFGRLATPRVLYAIHCANYALVGGTATLDFFSFVPGSTAGSGTHLNSTSFNANSGTSEVSLTLNSTSIPANYDVGVVPIGAGWTSSAGGGMCQASYR